jgi:hypothetical protein
MGDVAWFLRCSCVWQHITNSKLTVSITQIAKIESILDEFGMADCDATATHFCLGAVIHRIPHDGVNPDAKPLLIKPYQ